MLHHHQERIFDTQLFDQINNAGWFNVHIAEEKNSPAFAFTIGHFHKHNHPELIVVGLPPDVAHELLNTAAVKIVGGKESIETHKQYTDFTEGLSVSFVPVDCDHYREFLGHANWYYGTLPKPYPVIQLVGLTAREDFHGKIVTMQAFQGFNHYWGPRPNRGMQTDVVYGRAADARRYGVNSTIRCVLNKYGVTCAR